jgi:hypothetical protein
MVYRPLRIFLPRFFDDRGRCESLATKISFVVDGFHRAAKMLMYMAVLVDGRPNQGLLYTKQIGPPKVDKT